MLAGLWAPSSLMSKYWQGKMLLNFSVQMESRGDKMARPLAKVIHFSTSFPDVTNPWWRQNPVFLKITFEWRPSSFSSSEKLNFICLRWMSSQPFIFNLRYVTNDQLMNENENSEMESPDASFQTVEINLNKLESHVDTKWHLSSCFLSVQNLGNYRF